MIDPHAILAQRTRSSQRPALVQTRSGRGFQPLDPRVEDVLVEDVIYGMAGEFRYSNQTYPRITVAEHAILVSRIVEVLWPGSPGLVQAGVLHDACEAYTVDLPSPVRKHVQCMLPTGEIVPWETMDHRVSRVVCRALGVDPDLLEAPEVAAADLLALVYEIRDTASLAHADPESWGLPPLPEAVEHFRMEFWSPAEAEIHLRHRFKELGLMEPQHGK